jgi:general stress protein 26
MANHRNKISMSVTEMWDFIDSQKTIQVSSLNSDGTPHLIPMWFAIVENKIVLVSYTKSQKIVNLKRNPNIAVLIEDGAEYQKLRGVSINCTADLVEDHELVQSLETKLILRNQIDLTFTQAEKMAKEMSKKKTAILIELQKVMSWDHRKLDVNY